MFLILGFKIYKMIKRVDDNLIYRQERALLFYESSNVINNRTKFYAKSVYSYTSMCVFFRNPQLHTEVCMRMVVREIDFNDVFAVPEFAIDSQMLTKGINGIHRIDPEREQVNQATCSSKSIVSAIIENVKQ